jgi:hypothetical protein
MVWRRLPRSGSVGRKTARRKRPAARKRNGATASPKLTQTQIAILLEAANDMRGWVTTTTAVGRGPQGGLVNTGKRERAAANKLRDAGLLAFEQRSKSLKTERGWSIDIVDTLWSITPEGRAAAAALGAKRNGRRG